MHAVLVKLAERAERAGVELDRLGLPDLGLTVEPPLLDSAGG